MPNSPTAVVAHASAPAPRAQANLPSPSKISGRAGDQPNTEKHLLTVGARVSQSLQGFLSILIIISIFGASTFSSLVSQLGEPLKFSLSTIRTSLALAWLFFVSALVVVMVSAVIVDPYVAKPRGSGDDEPAEYDCYFEAEARLFLRAGG